MKSLGKARMVGWSSFSLFDGGTVDFFRLGLNSLRLRVYFVYHGSLGLFFVVSVAAATNTEGAVWDN